MKGGGSVAEHRVLGLVPVSRFYRGGKATRLGRMFSRFWAAWSALGLPSFRMVELELTGRKSGKPVRLASRRWPVKPTSSPCWVNAPGSAMREPIPTPRLSGSGAIRCGWFRSPIGRRSSRPTFASRRARARTSASAPLPPWRPVRASPPTIRSSGSPARLLPTRSKAVKAIPEQA